MEAFEQVHRLILQGLEDGAYPRAALAVGIGDRTYLQRTYGTGPRNRAVDGAADQPGLSCPEQS